MKDSADQQTVDGFKRGPGRPAKYDNAAERQKAYRNRKKEKTINVSDLGAKTMRLMMSMRDKQREGKGESKAAWCDRAAGAMWLWESMTILIDDKEVRELESILKGILKSMESN